MPDYHKYVFDMDRRELVGEFEKMYQNESANIYDSWQQEDSRQLNRSIDLAIINEWNFGSILDIGCGKGALTHLLKKKNNRVLGLDIAETAVSVARSRFPDIDFEQIDVNDMSAMRSLVETVGEKWGGIDLAFSSECLSYIENWQELLKILSCRCRHLLISLYIPEDPIGFVKSMEELETEVSRHFKIIESVRLTQSRFIVVFAQSHEL